MTIHPNRSLDFRRLPDALMRERAEALRDDLSRRRSVRHFSNEAIPLDVVRAAIATAASAPSGANKQPWTFVLVTDPEVKAKIRAAAEEEERLFYTERAPDRWLADLEPLGTDAEKPFLEIAPALIVLFAHMTGADGSKNYYVRESVGIAAGMLIAALHHAGLATLPHTPSPMGFLSEILARPGNEKAYLLLPIGLPIEGCQVPAITRKPLDEVLVEV